MKKRPTTGQKTAGRIGEKNPWRPTGLGICLFSQAKPKNILIYEVSVDYSDEIFLSGVEKLALY